MARGIEAACWGTAIKDGEFRQSKAGNDFGIVNIAVNEGKTDDAGKEISTLREDLAVQRARARARRTSKRAIGAMSKERLARRFGPAQSTGSHASI